MTLCQHKQCGRLWGRLVCQSRWATSQISPWGSGHGHPVQVGQATDTQGIWEECDRVPICCYQDMRESSILLGGIAVVFSGDIYQILSIVSGGTQANKVDSRIKKASKLWERVEVMHLSINMHIHLYANGEQLLMSSWEVEIPISSSVNCIWIPPESGNIVTNIKELKIAVLAIYTNIITLCEERSLLWEMTKCCCDIPHIFPDLGTPRNATT